MTSFISGPLLTVHLDFVDSNNQLQTVSKKVTRWKILELIHIDSNNDQNIHWARGKAFSILLDPSWVQGLNISDLTNIDECRLERVFDSDSGTETWRVL